MLVTGCGDASAAVFRHCVRVPASGVAALVCRSAALTTKRAAARTTSPSVLLPLKLIFVKLIFVVSLCLCGKAVSLRETEGASERESARARARAFCPGTDCLTHCPAHMTQAVAGDLIRCHSPFHVENAGNCMSCRAVFGARYHGATVHGPGALPTGLFTASCAAPNEPAGRAAGPSGAPIRP